MPSWLTWRSIVKTALWAIAGKGGDQHGHFFGGGLIDDPAGHGVPSWIELGDFRMLQTNAKSIIAASDFNKIRHKPALGLLPTINTNP